MKAIVCVKQVPDTSGKVAVNENGTLDRASMATIINPDDLNAVEAALVLKEQTGCEVDVVTMGPPPAEGMLRELLARGCDKGYLISAREFGGSDTYATSQIIAAGLNKIGIEADDIVFCGRQAIDGDTAQVGPQVAEKLGLPQVTYAESVNVEDGKAIVKRRLESGVETVECPLPLVVTVNGSADACRPRNARLIQKYKYAVTPSEKATLAEDKLKLVEARDFLNLKEWGAAEINADLEQCGLAGSPTKVKNVVNVVFVAKESKVIEGNDEEGLECLIKDLIAEHTIG